MTDHLEQTAAAVMVLFVFLKMLVEAVDSVCENRDLNLRRTCVTLVCLVSVNNDLLFFLCHDSSFPRTAGGMKKKTPPRPELYKSGLRSPKKINFGSHSRRRMNRSVKKPFIRKP